MKKIKFVFINSIIIIFTFASSAFPADVKNPSAKTSPAPVKVATPVAQPSAPILNPAQVKPAAVKPAVPGPAQSLPTAANATVQSQIKPGVPAMPVVKPPVQGSAALVAPAANATVANVTAANVTAPAPVSTGETYNYNPVGKPDPFKPFIAVETIEKKKVEKKEPLSIFPLQRAPAENYRVVGIAGDEQHRVAIAEDAAKKFYPLVKGTRIGLHNGKVVEIMSDRVIVEESDKKKVKRIILKLRKD